MHNPLRACLALLLFATFSAAGLTQPPPLSLRQAVRLSIEKSPGRRIAQADADSAKIGTRIARTALLPNLFFTETATRGNDPVYVFGIRLRQQRFQQSDFSLNSLNRPAPINNFVSRFSGNWMAFDFWHTQLEIQRADLLAKAAFAAAAHSDDEIIRQVVEAYQSVLLGLRQSDMADQEVHTAEALEASSDARVTAGLAVDADKLTASANLAERTQEQIAAQGRVAIDWAELEALIGDTIPQERRELQPIIERKFNLSPLADSVAVGIRSRSDRQSLGLAKDAQSIAVRSAKSAFGPQISTFGTWESDKQSITGGGGNNWVAGAELRLDILPVARRENLAAARIAVRRIEAATDSADQRIKLDVTRAYYQHQAASKMLAVARASTEQTEGSLRILKDRYEAGLTTITEVLRAEDAQRQSRTNYWQAVFQNTLTYANLRFASGTLTADSVEDLQ